MAVFFVWNIKKFIVLCWLPESNSTVLLLRNIKKFNLLCCLPKFDLASIIAILNIYYCGVRWKIRVMNHSNPRLSNGFFSTRSMSASDWAAEKLRYDLNYIMLQKNNYWDIFLNVCKKNWKLVWSCKLGLYKNSFTIFCIKILHWLNWMMSPWNSARVHTLHINYQPIN